VIFNILLTMTNLPRIRQFVHALRWLVGVELLCLRQNCGLHNAAQIPISGCFISRNECKIRANNNMLVYFNSGRCLWVNCRSM